MENATKGLMIAGAILIAIVLIGIGVFLVGQAQGWLGNAGSQFSDMDKSQFNNPFLSYEGTKMGADIKSLLTTINTNNMTYGPTGQDVDQKLIRVTMSVASGATMPNGVPPSAVGTGVMDGNSGVTDSTDLVAIRSAINTGKSYKVSMWYASDTGLIHAINIEVQK